MSYTYPEALNAMQGVATDLLKASFPDTLFNVRVAADAVTGTASVDWNGTPGVDAGVRVTINMPVRKATYRMSADEFRHWAAYLLHEVGHPNDTSKTVWKDAVATGRHRLLNALEDVRIEKATIGRGIAHNAKQVLSELVDMLHTKAVVDGYDPNEPKSIGWTLSTLGRHANGYAVDVSDITAKLDPNGIVGKVVSWALTDLDACRSTQDCLDLSDRVVAAINAGMKADKADKGAQQPEEPSQKGKGKRDGEKGLDMPKPPVGAPQPPQGGMVEDREDEADKAEAESEAESEPEGEAEPEDENEPDVDQEPEAFTASDVEEVDLHPTDSGDMVAGSEAATQAQIVYRLRRAAERAAQPGVGEGRVAGRDRDGSVAFVTGKASRMGRQRQLLAQALKREEQESFDGGRTSGRLNTRALHKLTTGSDTIFGKRTLSEGYDTDLQVLIDGSGSMAGQRMLAAASLALVASQAAAQVGVTCTAHIFTDSGLGLLTKGREKPVGRKFAYAYNQTGGSTPLTESMLLAAHLQAKRANGKRRVMLVITDGGCNNGPEVVKAAAEYLEQAMHVEIANLHIGSQVLGIFRNEVAVNVSDVASVGLKQLTAVMGRGA
jgi:cobalamin biosynthesis protein CobT